MIKEGKYLTELKKDLKKAEGENKDGIREETKRNKTKT